MRGCEISKKRNHITSPKTHRATIVCRIKGIPLNILNNLQSIIEIGLNFAHYKDTRTYVDLTVLSIAKAINHVASPPYETSIFIDGLKKTERMFFGSSLRKLNIKVRKVRGLRDESDEFIRWADAIAGFVRDCFEKDPKMKDLYEQALKSKVIQEI